MKLILILLLLMPPQAQNKLEADARLIVDKPYEWAIGYSPDGTRTLVTTSGSWTEVDTLDMTDVIENGGTLLHNHVWRKGACPGLSVADLLVGAATNLKVMAVVSRVAGKIRLTMAVRSDAGWNLKAINLPEINKILTRNQRIYGTCEGYDRAWQELAGKYGYVYKIA